MGRGLDEDPHGGPPKQQREKRKVRLWSGSLTWVSIILFFFFFSGTLTLYLAGRAGVFCNENTGIVAALKHHHHPLKYLANSYFGQGGGEACL